jgi:hypothetical protein
MKTKIKATTRQEELMYAFNFSDADLEANREGRVGESRYRAIVKQRQSQGTSGEFLGAISIIIAILILFWGGTRIFTDTSLSALVFSIVGVSFFSVVGGILILSKDTSSKRKVSPEELAVESVQGIVVLDELKGGFSIGSLFFKVERHALLRIKHLEPHIVYFLPRSKIIVSVEVVES